MNVKSLLAVLLLLPALGVFAQPRYSPEKRAEQETQWIRLNIHPPEAILQKINAISLQYNRSMDSVNDAAVKNQDVRRRELMRNKDTAIRKLLTKAQYAKYYKHELTVRKRAATRYKGHQPY